VAERSRAGRAQRAEQAVIRACHRGLDVGALRDALLTSLRAVMPVDAAFVATADPETLLFTAAYAETPLDTSTAAFLDNEFGARDVNRFASLATSRRHVAWLDDATGNDRFASPRYRDIMRPLGLGDELRAALVVDGRCWGYLCLHRQDGPLGFTPEDAATIARIGPHLAAGLRQALLLQAAITSDPAAPGVVLLADDLSVIAVTAQAEYLLSLVENRSPQRLPLPVAVYAVATALAALERGTLNDAAQPAARIPTAAGPWLSLHASRLRAEVGQGPIAVVVEPAQAQATAPVLLSAYGLTAREADVARLVLRGLSTTAIADSLYISANTVQDHLKAVFDKTGVRSRRDLVGQFLGRRASQQPDDQ
jgi:DNA-binding CsgD family transcriptional regulator